MSDISYGAADLKMLKENAAFQAFVQDIRDRIAMTQAELESCPKDSVTVVGDGGKIKLIHGAEFHQGELLSLRFCLNSLQILTEDLEGGANG